MAGKSGRIGAGARPIGGIAADRRGRGNTPARCSGPGGEGDDRPGGNRGNGTLAGGQSAPLPRLRAARSLRLHRHGAFTAPGQPRCPVAGSVRVVAMNTTGNTGARAAIRLADIAALAAADFIPDARAYICDMSALSRSISPRRLSSMAPISVRSLASMFTPSMMML